MDVPTVTAERARSLAAAGTPVIDVRSRAEWDAGHAPGSVFLEDGEPAAEAARLAAGRQVLVICRSGNRSGQAVARWLPLGIDAVNVAGGLGAWQLAGGALVRDDGTPGTVA